MRFFARFPVPLALFAALGGLAAVQAPPASAETAFLALLATALMAVTVALEPSRVIGLAAVLVVTAAWIVEHGPHRGAVVTSVLLGSLAVVVGRRLSSAGLGGKGLGAARHRLGVGDWIGLALGLQLLCRDDLLLPPLWDERTIVSLFALPIVCGLALSILADRCGARTALVAGAAAGVLAPGWNVTVTLALVSLAAGALFTSAPRPWMRWAALGALVVAPVWNLPLGILFSLGGLAWTFHGRRSWLLPVVGAVALLLGGRGRPPLEVLELAAVLPIVLPGLVVASASRRPWALRGAVLTLAAAVVGGGQDALAGGVAMAMLGPRPKDEVPAARRLQEAWSAAIVLGTSLLAVYPWQRATPLDDLLGLLGLGNRLVAAVVVPVILAVATGLLALLARHFARPGTMRRRLSESTLVAVLVGLALLWELPSVEQVLIRHRAVYLDAETSRWTHDLGARPISEVVIDTNLIHGAELVPGTRVAVVELRDASREVLASWDLLAGDSTAEWAVARPDIAAQTPRSPPPWLSQVAPDGTFFSRRFRSRWRPPAPVEASFVRIRRVADLPAATQLAIYCVELRR